MSVWAQCFKGIAMLASTVAIVFNGASAADIKIKNDLREIVIEGEIRKGDHEKLLSAILEKGIEFRKVFLASNGGDVEEAIKIGRLVRSLSYSTEVGKRFGDKRFCDKIVDQKNCMCASACTLIYLSGVKRSGDSLSVHRVYLNHDSLKRLSLEESRYVSEYLETLTSEYLTEMGAPLSYVEIMSSAASDRLVHLDKDYVEKNLSGYIKGYDEALIAKCGSSDNAFKQLVKESASQKERDRLLSNFESIYHCEQSELKYEVERKYFEAISSAIRIADGRHIPPNGLLAYLKNNEVRDLADLLGRSSVDGLKLLAMFGVGDGYKRYSYSFNDEAIRFNGSVRVLFDANSTIHSVGVIFYKSDSEGEEPYSGKLIEGITSKSKPNDFVKAFGQPFDSGCIEISGVCMMWFNTPRFSAHVGFEADRETLRFVTLNKPNYYKK